MAVEGAALPPDEQLEVAGEPEYAPAAALPVLPGRRLASIDALRGFDMFWLMQEETGLVLALAAALHLPFQALLAKELDHTPWVGITFWDLIAPLFLFIVGLSLPFAIQSRLRRGESRKTILLHILRRTALLIVLGLVFNGILQLNFSDFRYTGVLQRIALSYVFAAIITLMTKLRGQIAWTVALLVGYWAIMALIPVPGFGRNVLTEQGNLEGYIDRLFLPGKFCCYVFGDNEGYLSTIPSVATVMLGVLCAHILQAKRSERFKVLALVGGGFASLALGWVWGMAFPIITRLWTSSYTHLQQWLVHAVLRAFLLDHRCEGLHQMGFLAKGDRAQCSDDLSGTGVIRLQAHREYICRGPGAPFRRLWGIGYGRRRRGVEVGFPLFPLPAKDIP